MKPGTCPPVSMDIKYISWLRKVIAAPGKLIVYC